MGLSNYLPQFLGQPLSIGRAVIRQMGKHQALRSHRASLSEHHLATCKLLPTRSDLVACLPQRAVVAEVGVSEGDFSQLILEVSQPQTLYLIDLWESSAAAFGQPAAEKVSRKFVEFQERGVVKIIRGYSWECLKELPHYSLDWVYIDASHEYEDVVRDLEAARGAIKPGGYIAGHDYVVWSSPTLRFGVVEAVNEFCVRHDFRFRYLTMEPNGHFSYAIQADAKQP